jgi:hypothetical protein
MPDPALHGNHDPCPACEAMAGQWGGYAMEVAA